MYVTPEQIATSNKAGLEALLSLAHSQFAAFERFTAFNFNATKTAFEDSVSHTKALLSAKDVQDFVNINNSLSQPALDKVAAYSRGIYEVATQTHGEMTRYVDAQAAEFNKNVVGVLDKFAKNAPAGSDVAIAAVKSALAAANSAYDSINKVAKQASEIAEGSYAAAAGTVKESRKKAA